MAKSVKTDNRASATPPRRTEGKSRRWVLLLLVSVWMFVLGVLVGRGTSPVHFDTESLQKELASLREAVLEKEKNRFRIFESEPNKEAENLEFYENLKKTAPEKPPAPETPPHPKPAPGAAVRSEQKPKPSPPAPSRPAPAPGKPSGLGANEIPAAEKPYTIQVASLKDARTADALVEKLRAGGYPAYRELAVIEGKGTWHRVRIGSYTGPQDAARTLARLKDARLKPLLIRK